jgi:hypothetical protein
MYSHVQRAHHVLTKFGKLHVVTVCFNPMRFVSRYNLFREFRERCKAAGAEVHIAEASFGERPHEVRNDVQDQDFKFRIRDELWQKEALINATVARLPSDWKYVAWIDGDVGFTDHNWVQETIQQLQHFAIVQMFHTAVDLDAQGNITNTFKGFPASWLENRNEPDTACSDYYYHGKGKKGYWHPGYAWACTRQAWDAMGGLLDINVVGGGDHQMCRALYGGAAKAIPFKSTVPYRNAVLGWQTHAMRLQQNVGFVPGTLLHYWHGHKAARGYFDRWKILADNKFDPIKDLRRDWQGLLQLAGNKPQLRDDLRRYFRMRQEDSI